MTKQLEIAGTGIPKNADIESALDTWLEAKEEQKRAAETTKLRHATLLLHMSNAGVDRYPFVDRTTGKKRHVVIARDPKAKTINAPKHARRDDDVEIGEEVVVEDAPEPESSDNVVEMRRVKRNRKHDAIVDPFASTRSEMKATE